MRDQRDTDSINSLKTAQDVLNELNLSKKSKEGNEEV